MGVFLASLAVSILTCFFGYRLVKSYTKEYQRRNDEELITPEQGDDFLGWPGKPTSTDVTQVQSLVPSEASSLRGYGVSTRTMESWFFQCFDMAANFPASILTLIAFAGLPASLGNTLLVIFVILAVAITALFAALAQVSVAARYWNWSVMRHNLSYLSLVLILANAVGLIIAIHQSK